MTIASIVGGLIWCFRVIQSLEYRRIIAMIGTRDCTKRRATVFVDSDPATYNLNPGNIQRAISFANQAIIPVQ